MRTARLVVALLVCAGALLRVNTALAQCQPEWLPQPQGGALNGVVRALGTYQRELVIGGSFTQASGLSANRVARWDGQQWAALGSGVNGAVYAVQEFNRDLYVGGDFSAAGGEPAGGIARWNGNAWSSLGTTLGPFYDLTIYDNGVVVTSGGVARWDGASWHGFGAGIDFTSTTLAAHEGYLYAGGFETIGFEPIARVARWDGQFWTNLPMIPAGGVGHQVTSLGVSQDVLHAGGMNTAVAVHQWDGSTWDPLGTQSMWINTLALVSFRGDLVAGGTVPNGSQGLARWNGSAWTNLGLGLNGAVNALLVHDDTLIAGGFFTLAGGLPSPYWARYGCPCEPDCNNSGSLTIADFGCFQSQYVLGDPYADCNASGTLTIADFGCFQGTYVLGCP
ncbi:MAG: hypothetical protein ACKVU4_15310 [Phycisphaerales bacterium]